MSPKSESDDDSDDEDDDENGENYTTGNLIDNHMNIDEKEIVENAGTEENINTDTTAINQGADCCINNNNRESEATVENTERGDQEKNWKDELSQSPESAVGPGYEIYLTRLVVTETNMKGSSKTILRKTLVKRSIYARLGLKGLNQGNQGAVCT